MERDEERRSGQEHGERASDTESLVGETPTSEPLTTSPRVQPPERESRTGDAPGAGAPAEALRDRDFEREAELGHS